MARTMKNFPWLGLDVVHYMELALSSIDRKTFIDHWYFQHSGGVVQKELSRHGRTFDHTF